MMYEIGCPKTYARIFVETIKGKLIPFKNILLNKFQLRLDDLVASLEKMLKYLLKAFSIDDIFAYRIMDITNFFNKRFLDSLLSANEKINNIENVNAFSKSVCIPIVLNIANLAEVNVDYSNRDKSILFFSYDDLQIMADIIEDKKYLFIDFCNQLLENAKKETFVDDCIDMFAFYCQCKNLSILFNENVNVIIYQLGNDYFKKKFFICH